MEFIELILINKLDGVILKYPHQENVDGTICITGHHLILSSRLEGVRELWLLHKNIDSIEKKENKAIGGVTQGGSLFLKCKDLRIFQLEISNSIELGLLAQTLEKLSGLNDATLFYPFFYRHMHPIMENGYTLYSIEGEFTKVLATEEWRISRVNQRYDVCASYPKSLVVPKNVDDDTLIAAALFRQGGRFPVLSYRHNNGLLHKNIDSIEKKENKAIGGVTQGGSLFLKCKDLRIFQLEISNSIELGLLAQTLEKLSGLNDATLFYPFFYRHMHPIMENGYTLYSIEGEFTKVLATEEWRISRVNQRYDVCASYPKSLVVPKNVDDDTLIAAALFRQGGRFPVLSYRHNNGLLHKNIDSIEKKENKAIGGVTQGGSLFLKCKDLRIFQLEISNSIELGLLAQTLEKLSGLNDATLFYPFFYRHMHPIMENGYTLYSIEGEFTKVLATEEWRISRVNQRYDVCASYPKSLVVPKNVDDDTLIAAALFRQGGRFPVLSYRHNNGAVLMRAGQPLYGPKHRRCRQDEKILNSVVAVGMKGIIYDLRSTNAIAQQQNKGGGTESNANYSQWKIYNRSMDEVDNQQLLDNFSKLIDACNDRDISSDKWISKLDSCGWPESVRNSLHTACIVAQHIHQKAEPVLVHGTRGEDATLLVCSLVQIILNPDCRTIRGLQALIDREWLQAGHPFGTRHSRGPYSSSSRAAPTFLLLLDCIRQFLEQFPCSFEYRQSFLITLFEHSYASQFGTFLCDSDQERATLDVYKQTTSLWSWVNQPDEMGNYINPLYEPTPTVIWPSVAPMSFVIWEELYLRWLIEQHTEEREEQFREIRNREQQLRSQAQHLRRELYEVAGQYYTRNNKETKAQEESKDKTLKC